MDWDKITLSETDLQIAKPEPIEEVNVVVIADGRQTTYKVPCERHDAENGDGIGTLCAIIVHMERRLRDLERNQKACD